MERQKTEQKRTGEWMQAEGNYRRAFRGETLGALQVEIQVEPVGQQLLSCGIAPLSNVFFFIYFKQHRK
jgi:hypothetical protein